MDTLEYATGVKVEPTTTSDKRLLDEASFQKLLEAAYVLQEHRGATPASEDEKPPKEDREPAANYTHTLAEIVETQTLIQAEQLNLEDAINMIAEKVRRITGADGAAIGMVEGDQLSYRAASGNAENLVGTRLALESSLSALCLFHGQVLQTPQSEKDPRFDPQICRARYAKSVVAVPVYHDGKVAAVLELVSSLANAFEEHDVRSCQLMAGLVTEAIARNSQLEWKQELAVERSTMLEALERLRPQLDRLTEPENPVPAEPLTVQSQPEPPPASRTIPAPPSPAPLPSAKCRSCGHDLEASEVFCGACGASRDSGDIQNKWATLWHLRVASEQQEQTAETSGEEYPSMEDIRAELERVLPDLTAAAARNQKEDDTPEEAGTFEFPGEPASSYRPADEPEPHAALVPQPLPTPAPVPEVWTSAAKTRQWLDAVKGEQPAARWLSLQWHTQRANIYLAAAAILLLVVIFARPQSRPAPGSPKSATAARTQAVPSAEARDSRPKLTLLDKMMVGLGLAEAPAAPVDLGDPNIQVWVDVHTALYYCPGSELYGKTPGGKFTTQRDAQQDQFEPALRKVCN